MVSYDVYSETFPQISTISIGRICIYIYLHFPTL